jgi:hypothetical protein
MKPGDFLCLAGEAHRAGRQGRARLEIHAQKVEATRHAADPSPPCGLCRTSSGFIRVLLEPEVGEHLVHDAHRPRHGPRRPSGGVGWKWVAAGHGGKVVGQVGM